MQNMNTKIDRPLVIFTHLPKTAGTTLKHITQRQFSPSETFEFYSLTRRPAKGIEQFKSIYPKRSKDLKFITGHMGFGLHEFIDQPSTYITVLRDPVKRVISFYYYLLRTNPNHADLQGCQGLEDFIKRANLAKNDMTQYLSGAKLKAQFNYTGGVQKEEQCYCDEEMLALAKQNLREKFTVVGTTEDFNKTLMLLKRKLGWQIYPYLKANVAKKKTSDRKISDEAMSLLENYSKFDIELYRYSKQLFNETVQQQGPDFLEEYEQFEQKIKNQNIDLSFKLSSFYNRSIHKIHQVLNQP